jgi:cellulose synthase/poly-beta-1,6-N-acetylglucosamine synthase-like glycosyltransferase
LRSFDPILLAYVVLGPVAWVLMFVGFFFGRARMTRLLRWQAAPTDPPASVTIFVPAKDEGEGIRRCIDTILAQDYPGFEIVAVDDRSTDDTGSILDQLALENPKLRAMHIPAGELPGGWLGKCNALWKATRDVDSEWLFFVDSDVTLDRAALSKALTLAVNRQYDALSILTRLESSSFWERLVLPLTGCAWAVMYAVSLTNEDTRKNIAAANGQFFLIRRSAYEAVGGHEAVRDQITEDVELMRLLKASGYRVRLLLGGHLASTRMHSTLPRLFHGWGRIFAGTSRRSPWRILGAMLFIMVSCYTVYPALVAGIVAFARSSDPSWLITSATHLALMTAYFAIVYRMSGNRARNAILFPLAGGILLGVFAFALRTCRTGKVKWRDTHFAAPVSAHRR